MSWSRIATKARPNELRNKLVAASAASTAKARMTQYQRKSFRSVKPNSSGRGTTSDSTPPVTTSQFRTAHRMMNCEARVAMAR